jgi:hypothetical protein
VRHAAADFATGGDRKDALEQLGPTANAAG